MSETVLVINSGSSSIKYQLIDTRADTAIAGGVVERIGEEESRLEHTHGDTTTERVEPVADHRNGMDRLLAAFDQVGPRLHDAGVVAVGHRVVMGGRAFDGPTLIDDEVIATIDRLSPLAPLHNPPNLTAIRVGTELLPDVPHVAVFDTAFFHHLPAAAATYAIDREIADAHDIRRFGFHGTSHQYVSARTAELLGRDRSGLRQIVLHLGNGASASAVVGGAAVETSMGMTPLEGLVMGTRSGDIDPAVVLHLARNAAMDIDELDELLNQRSGMLGLTGRNDMREVHELIADGDPAARLGLDVYVHRLKKYIGAYAAIMGGLDTLTFTAGVGEHDAVVRAEATGGLGHLGIEVDPGRNERVSDQARLISPDDSAVAVMVVPTDEELAIARQAVSIL
ncbi:MAG: acetate kinase [Acidimicrobiales bacterium]|nr:acetate kinase [Acidimicrobiales bacterium]